MDEANGGASVTATIGTGTTNTKSPRPRGHWSPREDEMLQQLVQHYGPQNWNSISEKLEGRSAKSCRFRWFNHLNPSLNTRPFSDEEEESLFGKRRSHNFISSSTTGHITMSNFLTKPSTEDEAADTINSGLCKKLPQQLGAASRASPASEITGTSMGAIPPNFLRLSSWSTEECSNGVTTMNELSSCGESSAGLQKFREEPESCTMHKNVGFIDFLGVGNSSQHHA